MKIDKSLPLNSSSSHQWNYPRKEQKVLWTSSCLLQTSHKCKFKEFLLSYFLPLHLSQFLSHVQTWRNKLSEFHGETLMKTFGVWERKDICCSFRKFVWSQGILPVRHSGIQFVSLTLLVSYLCVLVPSLPFDKSNRINQKFSTQVLKNSTYSRSNSEYF